MILLLAPVSNSSEAVAQSEWNLMASQLQPFFLYMGLIIFLNSRGILQAQWAQGRSF